MTIKLGQSSKNFKLSVDRGTRTPNKRLILHLGQPLGQVRPLLNMMDQIYIFKSNHINKIENEYFKEKINYNYFIIK